MKGFFRLIRFTKQSLIQIAGTKSEDICTANIRTLRGTGKILEIN